MNLNAINKRIQIEISSIRKKIINKNHIVFELEADSTIPSEYIIMMHFFGEIDIKLEKKNYEIFAQQTKQRWRMATVLWRRFKSECFCKIIFCIKTRWV